MDEGAAIGVVLFMFLFIFAIAIFYIICMWKIYTKAGEPGWACLVPVYNYMVLAKMAGKEEWWGLVIALFPPIGIFLLFVVVLELAKKFGKSAAYGLGLIFLGFIFLPMLAFGDAEYQA